MAADLRRPQQPCVRRRRLGTILGNERGRRKVIERDGQTHAERRTDRRAASQPE